MINRKKRWGVWEIGYNLGRAALVSVVVVGLYAGHKYNVRKNTERAEIEADSLRVAQSRLRTEKSGLEIRAGSLTRTVGSLQDTVKVEKQRAYEATALAQKALTNAQAYQTRASNAESKVSDLEQKATKEAKLRQETARVHPRANKGYEFRDGKSVDALAYEDRATNDPGELKARQEVYDKIGSIYGYEIFTRIEQERAGRKLKDQNGILIREVEEKNWTVTLLYEDGDKYEFRYKHPSLINPSGGKK